MRLTGAQMHLIGVFVEEEVTIFEVSYSGIIRIGQEMKDSVANVVVFQVIRQACTIAFDLFIGGHSAEDNFAEALVGNW